MFPQKTNKRHFFLYSCRVSTALQSALVDDSLQGTLAQKPFPQWAVGEDGGKIEKGNNDVVAATLSKTTWSQLLVFNKFLTAISGTDNGNSEPSVVHFGFFVLQRVFFPELGAFVWLAVVGNLSSESQNKIFAEVNCLAVAPRLVKICNDRAAVQHVHSFVFHLGGCSQSSPPTGSPAELMRVSAAARKGFYPNKGSNSTQLRLWATLQLN